jgi:hypothetical protein
MGCGQTLPPLSDYTMNGPYQTMTVNNTGPTGQTTDYTIVRPTMLGANGFKHPIATWGNGITTMPSYYPQLLASIASQGIVVIASNDSNDTAQELSAGLDWMVQQDSMPGDYQGVLDTKCLLTVGYSLGGGAAVNAGTHADVVAEISLHGVTGTSANMLHAPLLLTTSVTDTFVTPDGFVTPTYNNSVVQTFYATLQASGDPSNTGHLLPVGNGGPDLAGLIAWMRLWAFGDQDAKKYFWGPNALMCTGNYTCQTKMPGGQSQMTGF